MGNRARAGDTKHTQLCQILHLLWWPDHLLSFYQVGLTCCSVGTDSQSTEQHRAHPQKLSLVCLKAAHLFMSFSCLCFAWQRLRVPPDELTTEPGREITTSQQLQATTHRTLAILDSRKKKYADQINLIHSCPSPF